ncbi:MAG: exodeoxyribonuclease VII large subunit [Gammaproteobacteria bacterium]
MTNLFAQSAAGRDIYTITRLNREVRAVLEGSFPTLWVQGEISNLARPGSGHWYFSLKDQASQVRCAMFKNRNRYLKFRLDNGMQVIARATVSLYEGRGEFQLIIEQLEQAGAGALQQAFEELKQRLNKEGLFDEEHKKAIPAFPKCIGVVTSPTGAAIRDILTVLKRRYSCAGVIIYPVPVQGEAAAELIARTLAEADKRHETDVLILARGGGSLEDLWAFNQEVVARAVYQCDTPIVSGVGHEIDFTIADFVADQRAATPSAAAERVSPDQGELLERLGLFGNKLQIHIKHTLQHSTRTLSQLDKRLPRPMRQLQNLSQRIDDIALTMQRTMRAVVAEKRSCLLKIASEMNQYNPLQTLGLHREKCQYLANQLRLGMAHSLQTAKGNLEALDHALHTVSPLATLDRGYAIVTRIDNEAIVRDTGSLKPGETLMTRFARGRMHSTVKKIIEED